MVLKSSGPVSRPITTGSLTKVYGSLRYVVKRSIPSSDEVDLTREEDFFHPEDPPLSQSVIRTKVYHKKTCYEKNYFNFNLFLLQLGAWFV